MKQSLLILFAVIATFSASAQFRYTHTSNKKFKEIESNQVTIFTDANKVPANSEDVGIITCEDDNPKRCYKKAKQIAAKHGANGVYVKNIRETKGAEVVMNSIAGTFYTDKMTFIAVYTPTK